MRTKRFIDNIVRCVSGQSASGVIAVAPCLRAYAISGRNAEHATDAIHVSRRSRCHPLEPGQLNIFQLIRRTPGVCGLGLGPATIRSFAIRSR